MCGFTFKNAHALLKFETDMCFLKFGDKFQLLKAVPCANLKGFLIIIADDNVGFVSTTTLCANWLLYNLLYALAYPPPPTFCIALCFDSLGSNFVLFRVPIP